jgi:hypothetical protein
VSVAKPGQKAPRFGVIELTARSEVNKEADLVTLSAVRIAKGSFPGTSEQESDRYLTTLRAALPDRGWPASAQALQANLAITQARSAQKSLPVKNDPPQILFRTTPSLLVMIDGEPALRPAKGEPALMRVINSAPLILQEPSSATFYLWALGRWWEAKSATADDWKPGAAPPPSLDKAREAAGKDLDPLEGKDADGKPRFEAGAAPQIVVATKPTELLQAKGEPHFSPIPGTQLLYMANSSNDIFMELGSQAYYVLISGRWFSGKSLAGPWSFVPGKSLPPDFAKIPRDHEAADVLASVPGTSQAHEAAIANQIPQTATVRRDIEPTPASYDGGAPQWQAIDGTPLSYAVNTGVPVIRIDSKTYYMVQSGVWFIAGSPAGVWTVATTVPAVIYTIPPSSPLHHVTYVRIYSSTASTVLVGYTQGYYGTVMSSDGVVVYGTGYPYPPYIGSVWYPYPPSYGYGFYYSSGIYFGFVIGMPPYYGGCCWGGPPMVVHHGNVTINNSYNRWGGKSTSITGPGGRNLKATQIGDTTLAKGSGSNNVYAGRDGEVYRRDGNGDWQKYDGRGEGWSDLDKPQRGERPNQDLPRDRPQGGERPNQSLPGETRGSLDRAHQSRQAGEMRAQQMRQPGGFGGGGGRMGGGGRGGGRR